jgi:hypothetical protein
MKLLGALHLQNAKTLSFYKYYGARHLYVLIRKPYKILISIGAKQSTLTRR